MTTRTPTIPALLATAFTQHAARTALIEGDRSISYAQLQHAIAVAARHPAIHAPVDGDSRPVTIIAPLGIECTVLQLAAMFNGRICAPLEAWMPTDGLVEAIEQIGGPVICLDPDVSMALNAHGVALADSGSLHLDRLLADEACDLVDHTDDGNAAAMLLFTSGSTGRAKGVLLAHAALARMLEVDSATSDDTFSITAPPSFGFSIGQTLIPLTAGGVGVYVDLTRHSASEHRDLVVAHRITSVSGTAPLLLDMVRSGPGGRLEGIRSVLVGSQGSTPGEFESLRRVMPGSKVLNIYGSTETGVISKQEYRAADVLPMRGPIPAGRPLEGVEVMVLDDRDEQVARGGIGRLMARLPHPFLGYWNDPAATATKIMTTAGGREWIRTGDLGRIDVDGTVHVVGRTDDLVKIRGRFVDPTEIDGILVADERVESVATVAVPLDVPRQLHTFVVPADPNVTVRELRHLLAQSLPHFALPRRIILIDAIPMNDRGKTDRQVLSNLRPPDDSRSTDTPTLSRSNAEESIIQLFREVLDTDVTLHDDFFAVGGDSLAAAELIAVFADEFHMELTPAQLVANPTAAMLLDHLDRRRPGISPAVVAPPDLITLYDGDHPTSLFWVLSGDHGFGTARLAHQIAPLRSWMVREIGTAPGERPLRSISAIGEHNAGVINDAVSAKTVLIGFSIASVIALETAASLARQGQMTDLLVLIDPPPCGLADLLPRSPNPLRRPRTALRFHRDRWNALHRPWAAENPRSRSGNLIRRTSLLALRHEVPAYEGPTAIILTEEYAVQGGPSLVDPSVGHHAERVVIPGIHRTALTRPEGLLVALDGLLRAHELV